MWRKILGAIVGYVVIFIWMIITLSLGWMALGDGFAFQGDSTRVTIGWVLLMLITGFVGAVLAGWLAALVAKSRGGATALAVLVLVLGLAMAFMYLNVDVAAEAEKTLAGRNPADLGPMDAAGVAIAPGWYNFLNPFVGALGAVLGGMLWARRR